LKRFLQNKDVNGRLIEIKSVEDFQTSGDWRMSAAFDWLEKVSKNTSTRAVVFVGSPQFDPRLGESYANAVFKKFIQCAASHCAPQIRVCAILGSPDAGDAFQSVLNFLIDAPSVTGQVITVPSP
jgi:hypothetical protein